MRITKLENTSNESIDVKLKDGSSLQLPPKCGMTNVDISNFPELKDKVTFTEDLTEVTSNKGKMRLDD